VVRGAGTWFACEVPVRIFRWLAGGVVLGLLGGACGGRANAPDDELSTQASGSASASSAGSGTVSMGNGGSSAGSGGSSPTIQPAAPRVPLQHRAAAETCDNERPAGSVLSYYSAYTDEERVSCEADADCTASPDCILCSAVCVTTARGKLCIDRSPETECVRDEDCSAGENGRCTDFRGGWQCTYDTCFTDGACDAGGPCRCEGAFWTDANTCLAGNCRVDADCGSGGYCSPTFGDCGNYSGVIGYYCHTPADTCVDDADCVEAGVGAGYCMYRPELAHWVCGYGQCVG
jgi:hypothetical protein